MSDDIIPIVGRHRGVPLHDRQDEARLTVVRAEIDRVLDLSDVDKLIELCGNVTWSPEARLTAAAKLRAMYELAAEDRKTRPPKIDLAYIGACTAGLNSRNWRSPRVYGSLLDPGPMPGEQGAVCRDVPLDEEAA